MTTELPFISSDVNNEYIGSVRGTGRQGDGYPTFARWYYILFLVMNVDLQMVTIQIIRRHKAVQSRSFYFRML